MKIYLFSAFVMAVPAMMMRFPFNVVAFGLALYLYSYWR